MLGRIAAVCGAAGHVHDSSTAGPGTEVSDSESAKIGSRLQVDLQGSLPSIRPDFSALTDRDRFIDAGVVDQDVNSPSEPVERCLPESFASERLREISGELVSAVALGSVTDYARALCLELASNGSANAAGGAGDEDVQ